MSANVGFIDGGVVKDVLASQPKHGASTLRMKRYLRHLLHHCLDPDDHDEI